jgi:hypothetical protein
MIDAYAPIKGKCIWWRERPDDDDLWDGRIAAGDKRVDCSCFVEGMGWTFRHADVPVDCPENRRCRYFIRHS